MKSVRRRTCVHCPTVLYLGTLSLGSGPAQDLDDASEGNLVLHSELSEIIQNYHLVVKGIVRPGPGIGIFSVEKVPL